MDHITEAKMLKTKIAKALQEMSFNRVDYKESEVLFRLDAIKGMLIMAHNDARNMLNEWQE